MSINDLWALVFVVGSVCFFYRRASLAVWIIAVGLFLVCLSQLSELSLVLLATYWSVFAGFTLLLGVKPIRRQLLTKTLLPLFKKALPTISVTEKEALAAGTVGWEAELFQGTPRWEHLLLRAKATLSSEEKAFIDGQTNELCHLIDEWDITHQRADLSPELWQFILENGFFGMIIPKKYGGLGFSANAHAGVLTKIFSRSATVGSTVAVPNSLGPAELLIEYGTEEQKNYYLPRLAKGQEIPCFALTNPHAGSDAAAMTDTGIVCKGSFKGKEVIGIRLNWDKRYITLAPVATVLGLAFRLYDPEHLLGEQRELGITCALIPVATEGVEIGRRHLPLNVPFQNGPTSGKDVFVPLDWIIGGPKMAGQGWRMLMERLAVGRGISLPCSAVGSGKMMAMATGAYARIRKQFGVAIGKFEGIEEPLSRIAGYTYLVDAMQRLTIGAIDRNEVPALKSAMTKYHTTELGRIIVNDSMDIHGGKGICLGPRNYLGRKYQGAPISITVEGANILTRNLIIFGQGAIRCHPYILKEIESLQNPDNKASLKQFDTALFGHIGYVISNIVRGIWLSITSGRFVNVPKRKNKRYYQYLTRFSAALALSADITLMILGGNLKRRERISARLGDLLSYLYMGSATLKRFVDDGEPADDQFFVDWIMQDLLYKIQKTFIMVFSNYPNKVLGKILKVILFPWGQRFTEPNDKLCHQLANVLITDNDSRQRLSEGIYLPDDKNDQLHFIEETFRRVIATDEIERKMLQAVKSDDCSVIAYSDKVKWALEKKIISKIESTQLLEMNAMRNEVIAVDDFDPKELSLSVVKIPTREKDILVVGGANH